MFKRTKMTQNAQNCSKQLKMIIIIQNTHNNSKYSKHRIAQNILYCSNLIKMDKRAQNSSKLFKLAQNI